jgi:hypothetical protein
MILLLKLTLFGILLFLLYGWLLEFFLDKTLGLGNNNHFTTTIFLGASLLAGLLGIWSFYSKIDSFTVRVFSLIALSSLTITWKYISTRAGDILGQLRTFNPISWFVFIAMITYGLFMAAASTPTYDTGLYHAQSIRWIETYPVISGLANLHTRLGFNSNLFLLGAFWGFADKSVYSYQVPGLIIFFTLVLYCLFIIEKSRKNLTFSSTVAFGILFYLMVDKNMIVWLASPSPDLSAAMLVWGVFLLVIEKIEDHSSVQPNTRGIEILILSLFAISFKLSVVPVLFFALYLQWDHGSSLSLKRFIATAGLSIIIFVPWIIRNIMLTGYLLFPFPQIDLFNFDWKVPTNTTRQLVLIIKAWGRLPYTNYKIVMSMPFTKWVLEWYRALSPADQFLINSIMLGAVLLTLCLVFYSQIRELVRQYGIIYTGSVISIIFWWVQAPLPRFGYGFLIPSLFIFFAPFIILLMSKRGISGLPVIILVEAVLLLYTINTCRNFPVKSWIHYKDTFKHYDIVKTYTEQVDNTLVFLPVNGDQCWYATFPCTPYIIKGLSMRGPVMEDGFFIKQK